MVGFTPGTVIVPRKMLYAVGFVPVTLPVPSTVTLTPTLVNGSGGADWYVTRAPSARVELVIWLAAIGAAPGPVSAIAAAVAAAAVV